MFKIGAALIVGAAVGVVAGMTVVAAHIYPDRSPLAALARFVDRAAWEAIHN